MVRHNVGIDMCGDTQCSHGEGCVVIYNVVMKRDMLLYTM